MLPSPLTRNLLLPNLPTVSFIRSVRGHVFTKPHAGYIKVAMPNFDRFVDYSGLLPESDEVYYYGEEQKTIKAAGDLRSKAYLNLRQYEETGSFIPKRIGFETWYLALQQEKAQRQIIELDEALGV